MDYKELKKDELVAKLEEQRHLAQAVEAKDVEIANISKQLAEIKLKANKEKQELENKVSELDAKLKAVPSITRYEDTIKKLEEENKRVIAFANQYINVFKNTLKALQGTLDNAIELQDMLVNTVKEK